MIFGDFVQIRKHHDYEVRICTTQKKYQKMASQKWCNTETLFSDNYYSMNNHLIYLQALQYCSNLHDTTFEDKASEAAEDFYNAVVSQYQSPKLDKLECA